MTRTHSTLFENVRAHSCFSELFTPHLPWDIRLFRCTRLRPNLKMFADINFERSLRELSKIMSADIRVFQNFAWDIRLYHCTRLRSC